MECFFFFSRLRCFVKEIRLRNIAIETLKRKTLARASRTSFVQALRHRALARHRAPTPHRSIRIEIQYNNTKSIPQPSRCSEKPSQLMTNK